MNDTEDDAREDLTTIVWAVLTQFEELDNVDEAAEMVVDAIISNGWPRKVEV
jgi:hypothetical protein